MKRIIRKSKRLIARLLVLVMMMATVLPYFGNTAVAASGLTLKEAGGWLEIAYAEWAPVSGAIGYTAYVKRASESDSAYEQLDTELIRQYSSYWRADAVGLAAGSYKMKIVAVFSNGSTVSKETGTLNVSAHDRTGFGWVKGTSSGAYNEDGTLKSNAVVLYVTEKTKNTVSMDVVTDSKGNKTTSKGLQTILNNYKKGYDSRPLAIRLVGNITDMSVMESGDILIKGGSSSKRLSTGITIEGIGEDATANGWGIRVANASNVEIRNIGFMNCHSDEGDSVGLQQNNDHIWVHNCDFFYGDAGSDADQVKGDGALDTKTSTYITHSYNHFYDTGKSNLQGMKSESTENYITYHHNWYDHSDSRHPRIRTCTVHIYNNYFDGIAKYGVGVTMGASAFVESNYFRNCPYPVLSSEQGSDVSNGKTGTFSSETGGIIKTYNNVMVGYKSYVTYQQNSTQFDAYEVSSKDTKVPSSVKTYKGGTTYNNFDTNSSLMYSYTAQSPEDAVKTVQTYAGRINGGDFSWTFDNSVDDASYTVNEALKSALTKYKTSLVAVGGYEGVVVPDSGNSDKETQAPTQAPTTSGNTSSETSYVHNFTKNGASSSFFDITGNLSTSKGTVSYAGLTLKQCLKMESSTKVSFTLDTAASLVLVFNADNSTSVKVDGNKKSLTDGILTMNLEAGTHTITKADKANLFYIALTVEGSNEPETEAPTEKPTQAPTQSSSKSWNFKNSSFNKLGTISSTVTVDGLSLIATSSKTMSVKAESQTVDGTAYTYALALGGGGSTSYRAVKVPVTGKDTIKVVLRSSGSSTRTLVVADASGKQLGTISAPADAAVGTYKYLGDAGYVYLYSAGSGINIYKIQVDSTGSGSSSGADSDSDSNSGSSSGTQVTSGDIYVAANGKSSGTGSESDPMDLVTAIKKITAGKTIWVKAGTYKLSSTILIDENNNGKSGAYKTVSAINDGKVILDFGAMSEDGANRGIVLDGDYWHFYGIDICNAGDNGMLLSGNNNKIEMCQFYGNHDTGLQISRYNTSANSISQWPSYNTVLNCTSFNNKDDATCENADGFAAKLTCGEGNVFDGCIAYCNSDDGWDLYAKPATGSIGVVTIKNCVSFGNGKLTDGTGSANGDMNGFKLGGSNGACPTAHVITNCLAFNNGACGFTDNGNGGAIKMTNCKSVNNGLYASKGNFMCYRTSSGATYKNLFSYGNSSSDKFLGKLTTSVTINGGKSYYTASGSYSSSTSPKTTSASVSSSVFKSTNISGYSNGKYATNYHEVFRNADGSVNMNGLFELSQSSSYAGLGCTLN